MLKEIPLYLTAFLDKWFFWVGIVFLIPELMKKIPRSKNFAEKLPHKLFWALSGLCLFLASFQLWHEEHERSQSEKAYLTSEMKEYYPGMATDLFLPNQSAKIDVHWRNVGRSPAENPVHFCKTYLAPDVSHNTQLKLIDEFKGEFEDRLKGIPKGEVSPIFPYGPGVPETICTAEGPVVSEDDLKKLHFSGGQEIVLVISAVRYRDNAGGHEAHACGYLAQWQRAGAQVQQRWEDCDGYVSTTEFR